MGKMKALLLGDAMIHSDGFAQAWEKHLGQYGVSDFAAWLKSVKE